jgi:proteasome accessory factor A
VQRYYLVEVREFLQRSWQVPAEAWRIIRLWQDALDTLQRSKHEEAGKKELLGKVDWASKRWMLQQVADDASWSVRKKVDLRFHELSEEGYYRKLTSAMGRPGLISREKIQQAKRLPPSDTPASKRGYLIREFSGCDAEVTAGWDYVRVVEDGKATLYDLTTANS